MRRITATLLVTAALLGVSATAAQGGSRWSAEPVAVVTAGSAWK